MNPVDPLLVTSIGTSAPELLSTQEAFWLPMPVPSWLVWYSVYGGCSVSVIRKLPAASPSSVTSKLVAPVCVSVVAVAGVIVSGGVSDAALNSHGSFGGVRVVDRPAVGDDPLHHGDRRRATGEHDSAQGASDGGEVRGLQVVGVGSVAAVVGRLPRDGLQVVRRTRTGHAGADTHGEDSAALALDQVGRGEGVVELAEAGVAGATAAEAGLRVGTVHGGVAVGDEHDQVEVVR
ncbi:hypothetical protein [Actinophytocola gossypii]|uniref:Uncharacterized protein n=1 Tax=Actinophytocola gossypii TaxID=2812003 RepID=A0ABT2J1N4_9PSEU|nr:hypothetical protein [Actinophytocola gossypii]MCT2581765.1 hypothetical protein [Actinophytocola gossypii]